MSVILRPFIPKTKSQKSSAIFFLQFFYITSPDPRRRRPITNQISQQQIFIFFSQITLYCLTLTRRPGKKYLPARFYIPGNLRIASLQIALYIFRLLHLRKFTYIFYPPMEYSAFFPHRCPEHHAPFQKNLPCQNRKHTSGRTGKTKGIFFCLRSQIFSFPRLSLFLALPFQWTDRLTLSAMNTFFLIYFGIRNPFPVFRHPNGMPGTDRHTGAAAAALAFLSHSDFGLHSSLPVRFFIQ